MNRSRRAIRRRRGVFLALVILLALCAACEAAPAGPEPTPTVAPTPTPSADIVLQNLRFVIRWNDQLLATEELTVEQFEGNLLVRSELIRHGPNPVIEQRLVQLSPVLRPIRYSLERRTMGTQSTWVAEYEGGAMDSLANNLAWYAPVLVPEISPAPGILLERAPSALPFAVLALQITDNRPLHDASPPWLSHALDIAEALPVSRPVTVSVSLDQGEAIIGTVALEGRIAGYANPRFTMWVRPGSRTLFRVTIEDHVADLWDQLGESALRTPGLVTIERVTHLPALPEALPEPGVVAEGVSFVGSDGAMRQGLLLRPEGAGPFPALLVQHPGGILPPPQGLAAFVRQGWAVFTYSPAGVGESEGVFQRAPSGLLAADARLAGEWLRQQPEINPERIVLVGIGQAGIVGAQVVAQPSPFAAAVLGSFATVLPLYPDLVEERILALATFYGWDDVALARYRQQSIEQWQEWLQAGYDEIGLLGRRASLTPLRVWQETDLVASLRQAQIPVLVLHGRADLWTPVDGAELLELLLHEEGVEAVTFRYLDGLGADLGGSAERLWDDQVDGLVSEWLQDTLGQ